MPDAGQKVGTGFVEVLPDADKFGKHLSSKVDKEAKAAGKTFTTGFSDRVTGGLDKMGASGAKFGGILQAGVAAGAVAAGRALVGMVADGTRALINWEKIGAITEATITSTGGAANVSGEHVRELAEEIERVSGIVEAEAVQAGENWLLTFTNVRNEAGKGNDVFDQTVRIMGDMAARGLDTEKSAIQLGKALNDPIKGVTALTKVGVSFTEQQRDQIRALVDSGNTLEAQKIILAELTREFGGAAEAIGDTTAGAVAKMNNEWGDFKEGLASGAIPLIKRASEATEALAGEGETAGKVFGESLTAGLIDHLVPFGSKLLELGDKTKEAGEKAKGAVAETKALASAEGELEEATEGATGATKAYIEAQEDATRAVLSRVSSELGLRQSQFGFADAIDDLAAKIRDKTNAQREDDKSLLDAEQAALSVAAAQVKLAEDNAKAAGQALSAAEANNITRQSLLNLAGTLDPASPLRQRLTQLAEELAQLPAKKVIDIEIRSHGVQTQFPDLPGFSATAPRTQGDIIEPRAAGGPVRAGSTYLVGEEGVELVTFDRNGWVTPHDEAFESGSRTSGVSLPGGGFEGDVYLDTHKVGRVIGRAQANRRRGRGR